jgi:hypothetical protein
MREIRPSSSMRGGEFPGRTDNYGRLIFIRELPAYSTHLRFVQVHATR